MEDSKKIDITKYVLDEKFWRHCTPKKHLTGHVYYMSSFESDDDCGTCNGAKCDYCKEITDKDNFDVAVQCDVLENIIKIHFDIDDEIIKELVYADIIDRSITKGYFIHWPNLDELEENYPIFYKKLTTPDNDIWIDAATVLNKYRLTPIKSFGDFRDIIERSLKGMFYQPHLDNQLSMMFDIFKSLDKEKDFDSYGSLSEIGRLNLANRLSNVQSRIII